MSDNSTHVKISQRSYCTTNISPTKMRNTRQCLALRGSVGPHLLWQPTANRGLSKEMKKPQLQQWLIPNYQVG